MLKAYQMGKLIKANKNKLLLLLGLLVNIANVSSVLTCTNLLIPECSARWVVFTTALVLASTAPALIIAFVIIKLDKEKDDLTSVFLIAFIIISIFLFVGSYNLTQF